MTTTALPSQAGRLRGTPAGADRSLRVRGRASGSSSCVLIGPEQFVNALTIGAIYALIALGYTMVYGIIELINFAHGDMFMVGAFVVDVPAHVDPRRGHGPAHGPRVLVVLTVIAFAGHDGHHGLVGVLIERFAYRPLRNAPRLAPLITAIGVSFILQNLIQIVYGPSPVNTPQIIPPTARVEILGVLVRTHQRLHHHDVGRADDRAPAVRVADAAGPRDALDRPGPRGRPADGREHQPDHRPDVLHRVGARGRRGRGLRALPRQHPVQARLQGRPEGVHRRRARRHRQHHRRGARRLHHRVRRGHRGRARPQPSGAPPSCSSS